MMPSVFNYVVERRVNRPSHAVARTLRDRSTVAPANGFALGDGRLFVDDVPRPVTGTPLPGLTSWRTTARLVTDRGKLVSRLDVEVGTWAPGSVFIQFRPLDRSPHRWGMRRTRRYFALAHAGADRLEQVLNHAPANDDRARVVIRPIEADDVEQLRDLFWRLSPETRYFRFLSPVNEPAESYLHYLAEVDHENRDALVATVDGHVVAVARYDRNAAQPQHAEVAVVVEDAWHRHGIATELLCALTNIAGDRGVEHFTAIVALENRAVVKLVRSLRVPATWKWDHGQQELDIDVSHLVA